MTVADGCYAQVIEAGAPALYRVRVAELEPRSRIGSGDAFLAGYVAARYGGQPPVDCLRYGVACGAESTQHIGAGVLEPAKVERLLDDVKVERIQRPGRDLLTVRAAAPSSFSRCKRERRRSRTSARC